jgi:hypothetical protein
VVGKSTGTCTDTKTVQVVACNILPLELTSFNAVKEEERVKLNWITKTEKNTDKFIIERSTDVNKWTEICSLKAAGNSSTEKRYDCYDDTPLQGISYYRLKTLDMDKTASYSDVRMVQFDHNKGTIVIHPNPAHDKLYIKYIGGDLAEGGIEITDATGRITIMSSEIKVGSEKDNATVNVSGLLRGVYFVVVTEKGIKQAKKFIIE